MHYKHIVVTYICEGVCSYVYVQLVPNQANFNKDVKCIVVPNENSCLGFMPVYQ